MKISVLTLALLLGANTSAKAQDYNFSIALGFGDLTSNSACIPGGETSGGGIFCSFDPDIVIAGGETSGGGITTLYGVGDISEVMSTLAKVDLKHYSEIDLAGVSGGLSASPNGCAAVLLVEGCTCSERAGGIPIVSCEGMGIKIDGLIGFPEQFGTVLPNMMIVAK